MPNHKIDMNPNSQINDRKRNSDGESVMIGSHRTISFTNDLNIYTCFQKDFDNFKLSSRTWTLIRVRHRESFSFFLLSFASRLGF